MKRPWEVDRRGCCSGLIKESGCCLEGRRVIWSGWPFLVFGLAEAQELDHGRT